MTVNWKTILGALALLGTGVALGVLLTGGERGPAGADSASTAEHAHQEDADAADTGGDEVWTCSMHPSVQADQPGSCPICGMDLIPADQMESDAEYTMTMSESARQLADIQTTEATRETPTREIELPGRVQVDERRITTVTAHFPGRIRDLKVDFTGAPIEEGQPMASIYSPELVSAQRELLEAVRHGGTDDGMAETARTKLRRWEISEETIQAIEERGEVQTEMDIVAPVSGHVLSRNVSHEQHVQEGTILYEVADLSRVWVVFEAYEADLQWLSEGDEVSFELRSDPGTEHTAPITYIDPVLDGNSRTVRVRAEMPNPDGQLTPDVLVQGTVQSDGTQGEQVTVPASAVLWTGPRSVAYVKDPSADAPRFEMREVTLGPRTGDDYVIEAGIEAGEHVVTNGAFTVDSEFQLADRRSMMNPESGTEDRSEHDHGGGDGEEVDRGDERPDYENMDHEDMDHEDMDHEDMDHEDMDEDDQEHDATEQAETGASPLPTPPSFQDEATAAFRAQLTEVVTAYLDATSALVKEDETGVRAGLAAMDDALEAVDMMELEGDAHDAWMQDLNALQSHLAHIDQLEDLSGLRGEVRTLSRILAYSVEQFGVDEEIYMQYCPMAFDEEGGHWLSRTETIRNPYEPDMQSCGENVKTLE